MFKGIEIFFTLAAVVGGPLLAVMIVPALARRFLGKTARWPGETPRGDRAEVEDLRERLVELDDMARRVAELEERVDFAERLLAQQRDAALPRPKA
jgi:hypothetical protein